MSREDFINHVFCLLGIREPTKEDKSFIWLWVDRGISNPFFLVEEYKRWRCIDCQPSIASRIQSEL
jgi:hypothetical protein